MTRMYEIKYGYVVPPPRRPLWLVHLRWLVPACALALVLASLPEWSPLVLDPAAPVSGFEQGDDESLRQLRQVARTFHQAVSEKNIDALMSLFADDATITTTDATYNDAAGVRRFWLASPPFHALTHWVSYTPVFRDSISVADGSAQMRFECLYMDPASASVAGHVAIEATLIRRAGGWVFAVMRAATVYRL